MKPILTALSLAVLAGTAWAGVEVTTNPDLRCVFQAPLEVTSALYL